MVDLVKILHDWTARKLHKRLLAKWGITWTCPWCGQCVEADGAHKIRPAKHCDLFETFTCGVCGGKSHWEFVPVPLPRGLGEPPPPAQWSIDADRATRDLLRKGNSDDQ